jgi:hypothetical protein
MAGGLIDFGLMRLLRGRKERETQFIQHPYPRPMNICASVHIRMKGCDLPLDGARASVDRKAYMYHTGA